MAGRGYGMLRGGSEVAPTLRGATRRGGAETGSLGPTSASGSGGSGVHGAELRPMDLVMPRAPPPPVAVPLAVEKGDRRLCLMHRREAATKAKKLLRITGKAAWIAGTTFLVLVVPLIIEMDREQQLNDLELQQQTLLGGPPAPIK